MWRHSGLLSIVVVACGFVCGLAPATVVSAAQADEAPKNVILIGWDGAQRDHLHEMIQRGEVPNLMALAKEGALVDIDVVTGATDTKAGWAQILSGYEPEKSGVYSNRRYQSIPKGGTIFERVEDRFGPDNVQTRAMIGKSGNVGAREPTKLTLDDWQKRVERKKKKGKKPPPVQFVEEGGQKFAVIPAQPFYQAKGSMDLFVNGLKANEAVGELTLKSLEECKDKHFLFFVHFAEPDHAGHQHGENSQEYTDAIKLDDLWTGKIVAKLKELGIYEKTLVYVVVDHGFNEGQTGHSYAPFVFLGTNDPQVKRNGVREDIAPTVLKRLGFDLSKIKPALDGIPLDEPAPERRAPKEPPVPVEKNKAKRKAA